MPKLFKVIKFFAFDEKCKVFIDAYPDTCQFEGYVTDIPYWLLELELTRDAPISVEDGVMCLVVKE